MLRARGFLCPNQVSTSDEELTFEPFSLPTSPEGGETEMAVFSVVCGFVQCTDNTNNEETNPHSGGGAGEVGIRTSAAVCPLNGKRGKFILEGSWDGRCLSQAPAS